MAVERIVLLDWA